LVTVTKSAPKEDALHPLDREQALGQRRGVGGADVGEIQRALLHHDPTGKELQSRWIGRLLGLDEQTYLLVEHLGGVAQVGDGTFPAPKDTSDVGTAGRAIKGILEGIRIRLWKL
jgi:hypothetical protein